MISSDFYAVYSSAGKKADGLVNLFCWAHLRQHFVRAGDANPAQLRYWTHAWLERIRDLYGACHYNCVSHGWTKIGRCDRHSAGKGTICEPGQQY